MAGARLIYLGAALIMRFGGYWLVSRYRIECHLLAFSVAMPATVLIAIVATAVVLQGHSELFDVFLTLHMSFRAQALVTTGAGVMALLLLR